MDTIEKYFNLPKDCNINNKIPKKAFTNNPEFDLKKEEKDLLKDYIESIYIEYCLKPQFINIPVYEDEYVKYTEIEIVKINIKDRTKEEKICEMIQKYIQYPMIIILCNEEYLKINGALKHINKVEKDKLIIEKMIYTDWINEDELSDNDKLFLESISINKITINNLFTVYRDFINCIESYNLSKVKGSFEVKSIHDTSHDIDILEKIEALENEIEILRSKIKKEVNMGAKVEINVKIKKLQRNIEKLKSELL